MLNIIEKRAHLRMNFVTTVTLESLQAGITEDSRMVNCSYNGIYFESNQFIQPGSEIFIRIDNLPEGQEESYKCHHAKVMWGKRLNNQPYSYGYGAKYVVISNKKNQLEADSGQIKNLRKYPRKYCGKNATFRFKHKTCDGFISDISRNGCFIENTEFINMGQKLDLFIPGTKFSENNRLKVEVARLSPTGVGVKFKRIIKKKP